MRTRILLAALGVAAAIGLSNLTPAAPARGYDTCTVNPAGTQVDGEEQAALDGINSLRARGGLAPLSISGTLTRAAEWKSGDLASGAVFGHDDSFRSWTQRLNDCGYRITDWVSENLAAGYAEGVATVGMWAGSPAHYANMMNPDIRYIGIARRAGGSYGWYWTADFGVTSGDIAATEGGW